MKKDELRNAVKGIHLGEEAKRDMIKNVKEETERKQKHGKNAKWQKTAAAAAVVVVAGGVVAFPVRAFISSYFMSPAVQVHMEDITEEESKTLLDDIDNPAYHAEKDADSYSREYTGDEKERMKALYQQYKKGVFPEKELQMAYTEEEAKQYELCYLADGCRFCLPERDMTDEEILEIIDFDLRRDYVLKERREEWYADELASKNAEMEAIIENGGITEEKAIEIAKGYLQDIYGIAEKGLDLESVYLEEGYAGMEEACYSIKWSDAPLYEENYSFLVAAKDGHLIDTTIILDGYLEQGGVSAEEAESKIPELHEKAVAFMKEKMGISFEQEYVYYKTDDDGITSNSVEFIFSNKDGDAYLVKYLWDGEFFQYGELSNNDISEYEDGKTSYDEFSGKSITSTFRQLNAN